MESVYYPSADGKTTIHAVIWQPENQIRGVVQIIHGMAEYAQRYSGFAEELVKNGFAVVAEDHLGHGASVLSPDCLGYFSEAGGHELVLQDVRTLTVKAKELFPNKPYFLLGHSMGSFFCRKYISLYGNELSGAIIMGTGDMPAAVLNLAKFLTRCQAKKYGWGYKSNFINNLAFGGYNKKINPQRTQFDWLSVNEENVDKYIADELCGFPFTLSGFAGLFGIMKEACKAKTVAAVPKNLPVYFVSGKEDPVGGYAKGVIKTYNRFIKAGIEDISMTLYEGARHEILNDFCAPQAIADILEFLNGKSE